MARVYQCCVPWCCSETHDPIQWTTVRQNGDRQCPIHNSGAQSMVKHSPPVFNQAKDGKPRKGQRVTRLLTADSRLCYVLSVKATEVGGNGTAVHTVTLENNLGTKAEDNVRVIQATDGTIHETTQWQCSTCECFTTCICDRSLQSGDQQ